MSGNKDKYFTVTYVVKAKNKTEAASALGIRRSTSGKVLASTPTVDRILASDAREMTAS